ncbi:hypothetical protein PybrP1_008629 [[Pythium] brassicae (nom. inval.)]|nr:hypothetical protein PybrP1_008629 [[Pythium] brassicae (nom. inval.)]
MGGSAWSFFESGSTQLFDKSAYLEYPSSSSSYDRGCSYSSKFAYYEALRQAAARMAVTRSKLPPPSLTTPASGTARESPGTGATEAPGDSAHASFMLAHWPREVDVVFDRPDDFPVSLSVTQELDFDLAETASVLTPDPVRSQEWGSHSRVASQEESVLKGLSESQLSSSEAIHKAIEQLRCKHQDDPTRFLRVLAKYPRATRLFASQQLHARLDVTRAFELCILRHDYAHAARVAGKLAYGEHASRVKKKLRRLELMARLLQHAVATESNNAITTSERARATPRSARSSDSFDHVMTDDAIALLRRQSELQTELGVECLVGSSLVETLHKLLALYASHVPALAMAVGVAEQFEVHPRQFSWALLKGFAQTEQWQALLVVTAAARPAIGFVPVVERLLDDDRAELAHDLLALVDEPHEREEIMALLAKYHASDHASAAVEEPAEVGNKDIS